MFCNIALLSLFLALSISGRNMCNIMVCWEETLGVEKERPYWLPCSRGLKIPKKNGAMTVYYSALDEFSAFYFDGGVWQMCILT